MSQEYPHPSPSEPILINFGPFYGWKERQKMRGYLWNQFSFRVEELLLILCSQKDLTIQTVCISFSANCIISIKCFFLKENAIDGFIKSVVKLFEVFHQHIKCRLASLQGTNS